MRSSRFAIACVAMAACSFGVARAGDLNPPGAPGSTMKTLDEVEPRIPVGPLTTPGNAVAVYRITQPGSYYLTGHVMGEAGKSGIEIESDNVTLDLCGFTLQGVAGSVSGVNMTEFQVSVTVQNGVVDGWGATGVNMSSDGGIVRNILARNCMKWGVDLGGSYTPLIENVTAFECGGATNDFSGGIRGGEARIRNCTVRFATGTGIEASFGSVTECTVRDVDASNFQSGGGIIGYMVESSLVLQTEGDGIAAAVLIRGCVADFTIGAPFVAPNIVDSY
jgi:hypothetical protein